MRTTDAAQSFPTPAMAERGLRVARLLYFFMFAAIGFYFPFINVYYRSIGLSGAEIGVIGSLSPLMGMLAGPLWGMASDRFGMTRMLLLVGIMGAMVSVFGLSIAPTFAVLLPITIAYAFFSSPIMPLLDSTTLDLLGSRADGYGRQRMWGSVGFVFTALGGGYLVQRAGLPWLFYGYIGLMAVVLVIATQLPMRRTRLTSPLRKGLAQLMRQRTWLIFSASLLVLGIANSGMNTFVNVYVTEMGGGKEMIGLIGAVSAIAEVPVMFLAAPLITRLGKRRTLAIAYALYSVRLLLYGFMPAPEWAIGIGLLTGVTFGGLWVAGVAYADALAPRELKATAQGLFSAVLYSLSGVIGSPISGMLFDSVGPAMLFRIYSVCGVIALGLLWWGTRPADVGRGA
jgi:PPP family 3-phenylpropionic acid transporter